VAVTRNFGNPAATRDGAGENRAVNIRVAALVVLLAASVLGGCATTVLGTAQPVPGQGPVKPPENPDDPCALLPPDQASQLELAKGEPEAADPKRRVPPGCKWRPADTDAPPGGTLYLVRATDQSVEEYEGSSGVQPLEQAQIGGLAWSRWPAFLGDGYCDLGVKLGETSFVMVSSENLEDKSKACDLAKAAAPYISSHLPGGSAAPPPTSKSTPPPSPLASVEPCALLKPDQLTQLRLNLDGEATGSGRSNGSDLPPGCQWDVAPGNPNQMLYLSVAADKSAEEIAYGDTPDTQVQANGRSWGLFEDANGIKGACMAILAFGEKSSVKITGGNHDDPAKGCDQTRQAIPMVTANLPAG
jgi:hypothetical protein